MYHQLISSTECDQYIMGSHTVVTSAEFRSELNFQPTSSLFRIQQYLTLGLESAIPGYKKNYIF